MKKTFNLTHPKTKYARLVDAVRSDIKRYLKRERKKALPEGFDTWDFDCKFGASVDEAKVVEVTALSKAISEAETQGLQSFYIEILAKAGHRPPKPVIEHSKEEANPIVASDEGIPQLRSE